MKRPDVFIPVEECAITESDAMSFEAVWIDGDQSVVVCS